MRDVATSALAEAHARSQGTETYASLAAKDHPLATRHPLPLIATDIVNKHTGVFDDSWRMEKVTDGHYQIINDAPYADYVDQGTSIMHPHTIREAIERIQTPKWQGILGRSISNALSTQRIGAYA